jgi:hypothetical protein
MRSRSIGMVIAAVAVAAVAAALSLAAPNRAQGLSVTAFPAPGSVSAHPRTQISLRGVAPDALGTVTVSGSRSGRVRGEFKPHSDQKGVSFVPSERLSGGERITVRTGLDVHGGRSGDFSFTIGRRPRARGIRDQPVPLPPLPPGNFETFRSQPGMKSPVVRITKPAATGTSNDSILLSPVSIEDSPTPDGPMIVDGRGHLVWFSQRERSRKLFDFKMQTYKGEPVLTWWEGRFAQGWGYGESIVVDQNYDEIKRVQAGNGYRTDLHDMVITPQNTAIVLAYDRVRRDLRSVHGSRDGVILDNVIQEIDLETGLVMFEWHSLGQVPMTAGHVPPVRGRTWDYFHINSATVGSDGNLLVSARNTCALYKISRRTGSIMWQLGGEGSDFKMGPGSRFCFQHDARWVGDDAISLFDNSAGPPALRKASRGLVLNVDEQAKTVSLQHAYKHPGGFSAPNQGSMQVLPNGNAFVGWGAIPVFTEYNAAGAFLFNGRLTRGKGSYRAVRADWTGRPSGAPRVATQPRGGRIAVWASWNGATEIASWQVLAGPAETGLQVVSTAPKRSFETLLQAPAGSKFVAVRALSASGATLGTSAPHEVEG